MRNKHFGKLGLMSVVILAALMLTGVGYGMWLDTINLDVTNHTGDLSAQIMAITTSSSNVTWSGSPSSGETPYIALTLAGALAGDYWATFTLQNAGTLPFKVDTIAPTDLPPGLPPGSLVTFTGIARGDQLEPGGARTVTVDIHLTETCSATFNVGFTVVVWNQFR